MAPGAGIGSRNQLPGKLPGYRRRYSVFRSDGIFGTHRASTSLLTTAATAVCVRDKGCDGKCAIIWYTGPVKIDSKKIRELCRERDVSIQDVLRDAGVSRNAYYTLARKDSLLPRSLRAVASSLGVEPDELVTHSHSPAEAAVLRLTRTQSICAQHESADPDNIRHTLMLLEENPVERLRRALRRGRKFDFR